MLNDNLNKEIKFEKDFKSEEFEILKKKKEKKKKKEFIKLFKKKLKSRKL